MPEQLELFQVCLSATERESERARESESERVRVRESERAREESKSARAREQDYMCGSMRTREVEKLVLQ